MPSGTVSLASTLSFADSAGTQMLSRLIPLLSLSPSIGALSTRLDEALAVPTIPINPTFPTTSGKIFCLYIRNTGNFDVQVTWTKQGGIASIVDTLNPGDAIIFWHTDNTKTNSGITFLSLGAIGTASTVEMFLAG